MANFHPYPVSIPTSEIFDLVLSAVRGKPVDVKEAVHGGWHVAGYLASKWDPHTPVMAGAKACGSETELADTLEAMKSAAASGHELSMGGLDWGAVLMMLVQWLSQFLRK